MTLEIFEQDFQNLTDGILSTLEKDNVTQNTSREYHTFNDNSLYGESRTEFIDTAKVIHEFSLVLHWSSNLLRLSVKKYRGNYYEKTYTEFNPAVITADIIEFMTLLTTPKVRRCRKGKSCSPKIIEISSEELEEQVKSYGIEDKT
jgi:hypothetical protein